MDPLEKLFSVCFLALLGCTALRGYEHYPSIGMSYKFHRGAVLWSTSRTVCSGEGATLAMPKNAAEVNVLVQILARYPAHVLDDIVHKDYILLGFHDVFEEGQYLTLGGDPIQDYFHTWGGSQPDNAGNEDCGSLHRAGVINDFPCQVPCVFVCEKPYSNRSLPIPDYRCQSKGYSYADATGKCYKLHMNPKKWSDARDTCYAEGGHLALINDEIERGYLSGMFRDPNNKVERVAHPDFALLGFHDMFTEGQYVTIRDENLGAVGEVRWAGGQPDNAGGNENCGSMWIDGTLNDFPCSVPAVFICEQPSLHIDLRFIQQR